MKTGRIFGIFAVAAALLSSPVAAQAGQQAMVISGDVKVVKTVTADDGTEQTELADTSVVVPGDKLLFRNNYRNQSAEPVENFKLTNPLSGAVVFADDNDPALEVSVDGGSTWAALADLTVTDEDGTTRAAQAGDVTHLRWTLEMIQPGETGQVTFNAFVR